MMPEPKSIVNDLPTDIRPTLSMSPRCPKCLLDSTGPGLAFSDGTICAGPDGTLHSRPNQLRPVTLHPCGACGTMHRTCDPYPWQEDTAAMLRALDLNDSARSQSCHEIVQTEILPAITTLIVRTRDLEYENTELAFENEALAHVRHDLVESQANLDHAIGGLNAAEKHITILRAQRDTMPDRIKALPWGRWCLELGVGNLDDIKNEVLNCCAAEVSNG